MKDVVENCEAIAVVISDRRDGKIMCKTLIQALHPMQALAIADALDKVEGVRAIPAYRSFDVFNRLVWLPSK